MRSNSGAEREELFVLVVSAEFHDAPNAGGAPKVTISVGHDTNIAHLGGALGIRWKAGDYPAGDPPPGGALVMEVLRDARGQRYVRLSYQAQTMDQLRNLDTLTLANPPSTPAITLPGCGTKAQPTLYPLASFERRVRATFP